jgi:hypothetical protein
MACALATVPVVLAAAGAAGAVACTAAAAGALLVTAGTSACAARAQRRSDLQHALGWAYAGYAAAFCLSAAVTLPVIDRWQNLPALARSIHADTAGLSLALLDPDETTIAVLDHGLDTPFTRLTSSAQGAPEAVRGWFAAHGRAGRVLVLLPGHARGDLTRFLARFHAIPEVQDGVAASLASSGTAVILRRYQLPQGRRYALLGPPAS